MTTITSRRIIAAPIATVFGMVTDIENSPETNADVVAVEFLTESRSGVGTRFRETRSMNGKEHVTELEVTEFVENEHVRMVADSHGTIWDTVFTVRPSGAQTELEIKMDARAQKLLPKLMNPLMKGFFKKGIEGHVDAVRDHCERLASS
jgi:uncharacterized protein YndB with AHSA1/START domain